MLDRDCNIKIIDLGLGNFFTKDSLLKTFCGSADYAAPELWKGQAYFAPSVDVWSLGVCLFAMLTKKMPFPNTAAIITATIQFPFSPQISQESRELLTGMLMKNPQQRLTVNQIREHPWTLSEGRPPPYVEQKGTETVDSQLLEKMGEWGFQPDLVKSSIANKEHNEITATYYLLANSKQKQIVRETPDHPHSELISTPKVDKISRCEAPKPAPLEQPSPPKHHHCLIA